MGFSDRNENRVTNPAQIFLSWNSKEKCFTYYDKESEKNQVVSTPFTFLVLKELSTIRGWDEDSKSQIYSNEVVDISKEKMAVRSFKGGLIAEGVYKDIKDKIVASGAHYSKSIYAMTKGGKLINVNLKGAAFGEWINFTKKSRNRLGDEWVTVTGSKTEKNGGVTYEVPVFSFSGVLSKDDFENATNADVIFKDYLSAYTNQNKVEERGESTPDDYPETTSEMSFTEDVEPAYESNDLPF